MDSSYWGSSMEDDVPDSQSYTKTSNLIRWKSGKRVDPRLLALLESFGEIYMERHEFFEKIFGGNICEELFKKIGNALRKKKEMKKAKSMPRSLSMRAIKRRGVDDEIDGLRLERFKVRTPNVVLIGQDGAGQGGQTQTTTQGSKDGK
ncbi:hypothetical protein Salat_0872000 [Sesamum alatum]|uniref:Uncharacterized protein n=1 Tax=Sesamum alatum TaxID=300844 RepID=A0AAE1YIW9_9LAMI|nr:hypothetical protein Salat_0872000 [Sesamum alatum]